MAAVTSRLDTTPSMTTNNLVDIINWLKEGDYVVVHNTATQAGRFFHKCSGDTKNDEEITKSLDNTRVIYVDVKSLPGLLDDGEWNYYITNACDKEINAGFKECTCSLKGRVSTFNVPHKHDLRLGF